MPYMLKKQENVVGSARFLGRPIKRRYAHRANESPDQVRAHGTLYGEYDGRVAASRHVVGESTSHEQGATTGAM